MKISEFIEELQKIQDREGDKEVHVATGWVAGVLFSSKKAVAVVEGNKVLIRDEPSEK